jgi:cytochrome c-type protein NapB
VGGAAVTTIALVGFLTGVERPRQGLPETTIRGEASAALPAPGYADLRAVRRGPNAGMYATAMSTFTARAEEGPPESDQDRARSTPRRAFDGAPLTIPHAIRQQGPPDCLGCHETGVVVTGRRAPKMNHARRESCTQCHVVRSSPDALGAP